MPLNLLSFCFLQTDDFHLYTLEGSDVGTPSEVHQIWLGLYLHVIVHRWAGVYPANHTLRATMETRLHQAGFENGWSDMSSLDGWNSAQAQTQAFPWHGQHMVQAASREALV